MTLGTVYYGIFILASAVTFKLVSETVTEPFIDEIFHLRQCQTYCAYKFNEWDNKITTPPGLYLLGFVYSKIILLFVPTNSLADVCGDLNILRSLNLFGGAVVLALVLYGLSPASNEKKNYYIANVISSPLLYTYYFLFYTDVWASILVILALYLVVKRPIGNLVSIYVSALVSFISLWFRQTNILWVIYVVVVLIDQRKKTKNEGLSFTTCKDFVLQAFKDFVMVAPFALVTVAFAGFVVYNGGVTLGDKENHKFNLHVVQVFYCFSFMTFFTVPVWLSVQTIKKYLKFTLGSALKVAFTVVSFVGIKYIVDNFTIVHPFLLADNRHYTFYLWRKILRVKYSWICLIPVYHFSTWTVVLNLLSNKSSLKLEPISIIAFIGCTCITIIPSPLFEPRYYILPLLIFRIFTSPKNEKHLSFEFAWNMLINLVTVTIFVNFEFPWDTETFPQRIIW